METAPNSYRPHHAPGMGERLSYIIILDRTKSSTEMTAALGIQIASQDLRADICFNRAMVGLSAVDRTNRRYLDSAPTYSHPLTS
jgi:hypothetical protein